MSLFGYIRIAAIALAVAIGLLLLALGIVAANRDEKKSEDKAKFGIAPGVIALIAGVVFALLILFGPGSSKIQIDGMGVVSFGILAGIWAGSAILSTMFVKRNYDKARALLIPVSASSRECRLIRLVFTIPIYTVVNHLLVLAFLSEHFSDNIWGAQSIFDYDTMITPKYLALCAAVLVSACSGGGLALVKDERKWDEKFFWKFVRFCASLGIVVPLVLFGGYTALRT